MYHRLQMIWLKKLCLPWYYWETSSGHQMPSPAIQIEIINIYFPQVFNLLEVEKHSVTLNYTIHIPRENFSVMFFKNPTQGLHWQSSGLSSEFPLQGAWVWSLRGENLSRGATQPKKKKFYKKDVCFQLTSYKITNNFEFWR